MEIVIITILAALIFGPFIFLIYKKLKHGREAKKILTKEFFFFHQDLGKKIEEFTNDKTVTDEEWEKILEIAKFADERFLNKCPEKMPEFVSLEQIVAEIIEDRKESK